MADQQIEALTLLSAHADAKLAVDDEFLVNNVSDTSNDAGGEPVRATAAQLGHLVRSSASPTTSDITATAGQMDDLDISGLSNDIDWTLPSSANVGERFALRIATGDNSFEVFLKNNTSQTIDGVDHGTNEKTKLFITGELYIVECIASNTFVTIHDGRIPQSAMLHDSGSPVQSITSALMHRSISTRKITTSGDIATPGDPPDITFRRDCRVIGFLKCRYVTVADGVRTLAFITVNDSTANVQRLDLDLTSPATTTNPILHVTGVFDISDGDTMEAYTYQDSGGAKDLGNATWSYARMAVMEILE